MKNILIAVLMLAANFCTAQIYVNQIDVNKFDYQYLELWDHFDKQSGKFIAMIDYGQDAPKSAHGQSYKVNEMNGEPKKFNGTIAMLNFMHKNGWELVGIKTTGEISSYILKRMPKMEISKDKDSAMDQDASGNETESSDGNQE